MNIGHKIIAEIISKEMIVGGYAEGLFVWSGNAAEQLESLVEKEITERLESITYCISTIADEEFGPFPVEPIETTLTRISKGIFEMRKRNETLELKLSDMDSNRIESLRQRITYIADQVFGPYNVEPVEYTLDRIENELFRLIKENEKLKSQLIFDTECGQGVHAWLDALASKKDPALELPND